MPYSRLAAKPVGHHGTHSMILLGIFGLIPSLFGGFQSSGDMAVRRVVIQEQVIIGVPVRPRMSRPVQWKEKKGPKCVPTGGIAGAFLSSRKSIDFVMRDRRRVRAKMDSDCPALDFYGRFYLTPDGPMLCAKRDMVHSRVGGSCRIEQFRLLVPKLED